MAKKVLSQFPMFGTAGADLSGSVTSSATNIEYKDNVGITLSWTGSTPIGTLAIQCSNDFGAIGVVTPTWIALDFGTTISITGNTGSSLITMNQLPFTAIRAVYTRVSGTGTLSALLSGKEI